MKVRGPAYIYSRTASSGAVRSFDDAFSLVHASLETAAAGNPVFAAHLEMLEDPLLRETYETELGFGMGPLEALDEACRSVCLMFSGIDDEYLRARVDDVRDVFGRLREAMCGGTEEREIPAGSIVVAEELLPSDLAKLDLSGVAGILSERGSSTSHVCIIAHARGIPVQLGTAVSGIGNGDMVTVDDPSLSAAAGIVAKVRAAGRKVYCNAGSLDEVRAAMAAGAEGIGVLRTEFLFMGRDAMPTEEEQRALYSDALKACSGKPLIIRLLDVGGDKALPYLPMPAEDNPYLGVRGVRFLLEHTELLETQLRAIAGAASAVPGSQARIMIPMVCTVEEVRRVREMLVSVAGEDAPVALGIMIETPAAVLNAAELASVCDFFSLGTNDLTQYVMAADRGNAAVSALYDPFSPAVRRAVAMAVEAAHDAGIPVGICGELASDPAATDWLLAAGLDSLSLSRM